MKNTENIKYQEKRERRQANIGQREHRNKNI